MPATPVRASSTRISRRTSSRSVADDQPSTSSAVAPPPSPIAIETDEDAVVEEEKKKKKTSDDLEIITPRTPVDRRIPYICSILLTENRSIRDKLYDFLNLITFLKSE